MTVLDDGLLARIHGRALSVDAENRFFAEDYDELVAAGYTKMFVPTELGGPGLTLSEVSKEQRKLAGAAGATALGINMHLVWTGVARAMHERGDHSPATVLKGCAKGDVFAFGISEAGNELMLFDSETEAVSDGNGGYVITGTKIFTSLSPRWTRLGIHAKIAGDDPNAGDLVFGFINRDDPGVEIVDDWDTLGMRGSQSCTTQLHGVHMAASDIIRKMPTGDTSDLLIFSIFANFELLLASVYLGIAERAYGLAVEAAKAKKSKATGKPYSQDPDIRRRVAHMGIMLDGLVPQLESAVAAVDAKADLGAAWFPRLVGVKYRVTTVAKQIVDDAFEVIGGRGYYANQEISRLYRDVMAGLFHPSDAESAHNTFANAAFGPLEP